MGAAAGAPPPPQAARARPATAGQRLRGSRKPGRGGTLAGAEGAVGVELWVESWVESWVEGGAMGSLQPAARRPGAAGHGQALRGDR